MGEKQQSDWIEWSGGICPVPAGSYAYLRFRHGYETEEPVYPHLMHWQRGHTDPRHDIIAYRLASTDRELEA